MRIFNVRSADAQPRPVGDPKWTGIDPLAAYSVGTTPEVSANLRMEELHTNPDAFSRA